MIKCPKCQNEMVENSRFCVICGEPNPTPSNPPPAAATDKTFLIGQGDSTAKTTINTGPAAGGTLKVSESKILSAGWAGDSAAVASTIPAPAAGGKDEISKIFETSGVCPSCYAPLKKGSFQCEECGYRLTGDYCARCHKPVAAGVQYCPECQGSIAQAGTASTAPVPSPPLPPTVMAAASGTGGTPAPTATTAYVASPTVATASPTVFTAAPTIAAAPFGTAAVPPAGPAPAPVKRGVPVWIFLVAAFFLLLVLAVGAYLGWRFLFAGKAPIVPEPSVISEKTIPAETAPESGGAPAMTGTPVNLLQQAQDYYRNMDYTRALESVQKYLAEKKDDIGAYALAARISRDLGNLDDARDYYLTALSHEPENGALHLDLANLYSSTGFPDKAIEQYREAVRLMPGSEEALWSLTQELARLKDTENTQKMARLYLNNFPSGAHRSDAETLLGRRPALAGQKPAGHQPGESSRPSTETATSAASAGSAEPAPPPPPPPPSPYVTVFLDASALNLPGKSFEVSVSFGGIQQKFSNSANMRIDNVERDSFPYTITVTYLNLTTNEQEGNYSGTGSITIRYPNQRLIIRKFGDRIMIQ